MKNFKTIFLVMGMLISFQLQPAVSCSCAAPGLVLNELDDSKAVFLGKVTEIKQSQYTFEVQRYWKGVLEKTVTISQGGSNCDFGFKEGETYLVYAFGSGEKGEILSTNICTRTKPLKDAADDIKELGQGELIT